jgi:hypothetical protein
LREPQTLTKDGSKTEKDSLGLHDHGVMHHVLLTAHGANHQQGMTAFVITPLYHHRYEGRARLLSPSDRDAEKAVGERASAAASVLMQETTTEIVSASHSRNQN